MSNFGSPSPEHTNALNQVAEARQKALEAVSQMRRAGAPPHHPNLAPTDEDEPHLATFCTQAVVDYLLQLRPYRANSSAWKVNFGTLSLPEQLAGKKSKRQHLDRGPAYHICRPPELPMRNVSEIVKVANQTVQYSTQLRHDPHPSPGSGVKSNPITDAVTGELGCATVVDATYKVETEEYGELTFDDYEVWKAVQVGALSPEEAVKFGATEDQEQEEEPEGDELVLGDPNVSNNPGDAPGSSNDVRTFNVVFTGDQLLTFVEIADEAAAEMDLLADLEAPDHDAGGGDAV